MDAPTLFLGYQPERTRNVEQIISGQSKPADVLRLARPWRLSMVRSLLDWLSLKPSDSQSSKRTAVLDLRGAGRDIQSALLKLVEEPPSSASLVLVAQSSHEVLDTIRSRCVIRQYRTPDIGSSVRDLQRMGMSIQNATSTASHLLRGYSVEDAPDESAYSRASNLINAAKQRDIEVGLRVAHSFDNGSLAALRERLLDGIMLYALPATYEARDPEGSATLVFWEILQRSK